LDQVRYSATQTPQIDLDHQVSEKDGELIFSWDVVDAMFAPGFVDLLFADYLGLLHAFAVRPELWSSPHFRDALPGRGQRALALTPAPGLGDFRIVTRVKERHERFPLSDLQRAYFVGRSSLISNGGVSCQMYQEFELLEPDLDRLERAWQRLIDTHEMLRVVIHSDGTQSIRADVPPYRIEVADLRRASPEARRAALARLRDAMVGHVFPLDQWPFFAVRLSLVEPGRAVMHVSIDLLMADAVSLQTLFTQLFALYQAPDAPSAAPALSFRDYQLALREFEGTPSHEAGTQYWRRRLADLPSGPDLRMTPPATKEPRRARGRLCGRLQAWKQLQARAAALGVSAETVLLGAYFEVLGTRSINRPFTVVVARWDRPPVHPAVADVIGDFTAISWVVSPTGGSFAERLQQIERTLAEDRAHPLVSGSRILQQLAMKSHERRFLTFPVVFTGLSPSLSGALPDGVTIGDQITQTPQVYLDNISIEAGEALDLHWDRVQGVFPEGVIESMFDTYCRILDRLARDPQPWHERQLDGLSALATPNRPPTPQGGAAARHVTTLHRLIEERVSLSPEDPAVVFGQERLTYGELNRRANRLARYLQKQGIGPDCRVGVLADRSIEMVVALLGILKAGGAYVPIDPSYPRERIDFVLEDAEISVLLTQERHRLDRCNATQLCLDTQGSVVATEAEHDLGPTTEPDRIAYVIYTSGSTGKPKGCMIPHFAICNRLLWMQDEYGLGPDDRVLQKTPYTFDVSVWEFFWPLVAGATLVMARPDGHKDTAYLVRAMEEEGITTCHFVPSMLNFFLKEPALPSRLRQVFVSGEALPFELMDAFLRRSGAKLHNLYGPTEAAVDVSYWSCERRPDGKVPIGRAIANVELHVLDERLRPVPAGEVGELHIGGVCLARGYLNRPELTREKFIQSPFDAQARLYKTGDLARYLEDGNIEFLGRRDSQVKLRGFRIELGEIEAVSLKHEAVRDVAVVVRDAETADPKLVAYVVPAAQPLPEKALKAYLKERLPDYMVPNRFIAVAEIPVTAHGKRDLKALPWPVERVPIAPAPAAPVAAAPRLSAASAETVSLALQRLFSDALHVQQIDAEADLFDLGATSLTVVQAAQRIEEQFGVELPVDVVLAAPTVGAISRYVFGRMKPAAAEVAATKTEPETAVNFLSQEERDRFKQRRLHLRHDLGGCPTVALTDAPVAAQLYRDRSSRYDYCAKPISFAAFSQLLALLRRYPSAQRTQFCYPSAGGTYAVQTYVHVKEGAVAGLEAGLYYFQPERNQLVLINAQPTIRRSHHFYYNREHFDRAGFGLYLIAQTDAIRPIYGDQDLSFATIEAGCMAQLLMSHQAEHDLGLCVLAGFDFDSVAEDFKLGSGHRYITCLLGGAVERGRGDGDRASEPIIRTDVSRASQPAPAGARQLAIIGRAGRYPGADTPEQLWPLLRDGKRAVTDLPESRAAARAEDPVDARRSRFGGYLSSIDRFDSLFFNISPAEAKLMDPQERLFIEVAWECLESAGYIPEELKRRGLRVGVFVGAMWNDYQNVGLESWLKEGRAQAGAFHSAIANRVSYLFDLGGPSMAVDTSCSSGLTALHLAARSLRERECDLALVGGVNLIGHPFHHELLAGLNLLSADDQTRSFGAEGTGWVPGEGVGALLLRPLAAAETEGDFIHAVVRGTAVGHGRAARYGMPSSDAQAGSIRSALADAELEAAEIGYVECAATGSGIADAAEVNALKQVLGERGIDRPPCVVGSIKPNIGHLESASALSQLTKVLLQFEHGQLAPTLDGGPLNPLIQLQGTPLEIHHEAGPWPGSREAGPWPGSREAGPWPGSRAPSPSSLRAPRRALINAFGATGSAAHAVLEEYLPRRAPTASGPQLFVLSADSVEQLRASALALREHLRAWREGGRIPAAADIAHTLQVGRRARKERLAIIADGAQELEARLGAFLDGQADDQERLFSGRVESGKRAPVSARQALPVLARSWVEGAPIPWHELGADHPRRRVPLPTYPFARPSHWFHRQFHRGSGPTAEVTARVVTKPSALRRATLALLLGVMAEVAELSPDQIDPESGLDRYGLNSLLIAQLTERLEATLGRLPKTLFFEHQTLASVADHLIASHREALQDHLGVHESTAVAEVAPRPSVPAAPARLAVSVAPSADIAIVGLAGRYPGADSIDAFWQNLRHGRDGITEVPAERWDAEAFFDREGGPGKTRQRWGGFLSHVDRFDPLLFNISPREAAAMDPQERLFLEIAWSAFEDAGYTRARLADQQRQRGIGGGVFVGSMYQQYAMLALAPDAEVSSSFWSIANRVSHFFDLRGPSLAIDTACASSLTAIHLACESLRRGECGLALAGGVNLHLHPSKYVALDRLGLLGTGAHSRSLGDGDGYVPGEGVGAVVLKPLADAIADQDRIYGVLKGSFVNHGGRTVSYGVPNSTAQADLIAAALKRAGIAPETIGYVEVAANGSSLGDAIEINGLDQAFRRFTDKKQFCAVGSVKSNIGHPEAASGIAQLTKVLCQLGHKAIVPTLHADPLNPQIDLKDGPFYVARELGEWTPVTSTENGRSTIHPRRAAISSFGAGGANCHLLVEEYVHPDRANGRALEPTVEAQPIRCIVPLSAQSAEQLRGYAATLAQDLERRMHLSGVGQAPLREADVVAVAHTLQMGREPMAARLAIVTDSLSELVTKLRGFVEGQVAVEGLHMGSVAASAAALLDGREGRAFLSILIEDGKLDKLARLWVGGATIDWRALRACATPPLVSLPHYPFANQRYWIAAAPPAAAAPPPASARKTNGVQLAVPSNRPRVVPTADSLAVEVRALLADTLRLDAREIDGDQLLRDYGLDSRLLAAFMRTLQKRFGHGVALTAAQAHPTLNRLTAHLQQVLGGGAPASAPPAAPRATKARDVIIPPRPLDADPRELVEINPTGSRRGSFWVHGAAGTTQPFFPLSAALGREYPFFAFQARGVDGAAMPFTSIEETAAHYVACLRQRQPDGPYFLGGLSSGGVIAFEMARQLRQRGAEIAQLVMLDTYPSFASNMEATEEYTDPTFHNLLMANAFLSFDPSGKAAIKPDDLVGLAPALQLPRMVQLIKERSQTALTTDQIYRLLSDSIAVYQLLDHALRSYEPQVLEGVDVTFFHAEKGFFAGANPLELPALDVFSGYDSVSPWRKWIRGNLDVVTMPCGHVEILEHPALDEVTRRLRASLA
jgi:amino acid adenylation domain-containing protein